MNTCAACGQENPAIARFCLACGEPFTDSAAPLHEERRFVSVIFTLVSLYYYLAVVRAMYMRPSEELRIAAVAGGSPPREPLLHIAVGISLAVSVGSLFAVGPVVDLTKHAVAALPF